MFQKTSKGLVGVLLLAAWLALSASVASAQVIADYRDDFQGVTPATGWDYLWNSTAAIGTSASYTSMGWQGGYYSPGGNTYPQAAPAAYLHLKSTGGHPGRGQSQGAGFDRYGIAGYTLQANGFLQLSASSVSVSNAAGNVEVAVYVDDTLVKTITRPGGGASSNFNQVLGNLTAGQTVYVAVGPNNADGNDSFGLDFSLEAVTSDATAMHWDADGTAPIDGGTGGWDTSTPLWYNLGGSGSYQSWSNASNYNAYLGGIGGTVTLAEAITARSLTFSSDGYTVGGGSTLTLTNSGSGGPGGRTIDVANASDTATIAATLNAGGLLQKVGAGTLVLTGTGNNLGTVRLDGGTTTFAGSSTSTAGSVLLADTGNAVINIQDSATLAASNMFFGETPGLNGVANQSGGTVTVSGQFRLGHWSNETSTYNMSGGTLTLTGTPSGTANEKNGIIYLGIDGSGIFNHSGGDVSAAGMRLDNRGDTPAVIDTYTMTGGSLTLGSSGIVANPSTQVNLGGGTVAASADWSSSVPMAITGTGGNTRFDPNGNTITLSGDLTGAGGLNVVDLGTLALSGNTVTLGGSVYVAQGTLDLDGSTVAVSGNTTVADRFVVNVTPTDAVLNINSGSSLTTNAIIIGNGGGSNINGTINQYAGTTVNTTGSTAENNGIRLGHYGGANGLYNLMGGTLTVGGGWDLGIATDGTGHFHQTGGILNVTRIMVNERTNGGGDGTLTLEGGTANIGAGGIATDEPNLSLTHVNYGGLGAIVRATATWSSSLDAVLSGVDGNAVTFDTNGNDITLSGVLSGTGQFRKTGAGTLIVSGDNSGLNGLRSLTGGVLRILHSNAMGTGIHADIDGGTLELVNVSGMTKLLYLQGAGVGGNGALRSVSGDNVYAGGVRIGNAPSATIGVDADSLTLTQTIQGWPDNNRGIIKVGAGTLILNSPTGSLYTAGTDLQAGTLLVNNTSGSGTGTGAVTVSGGILGGTGSIAGPVTFTTGGTLSPGASIGTLTTGDLTLSDASNSLFELFAPWQFGVSTGSTPNDLVVVNGDLVLNGDLTITPVDILSSGIYTLFTYTGSVSGDFDNLLFSGGYDGSISIDSVNGAVNLNLVPEPSTLAMLLGLVGLGLLGYLRRRRS